MHLEELLKLIWKKDNTWHLVHGDVNGIFKMENNVGEWYQTSTLETILWLVWRHEYVSQEDEDI